MKKNIPVKQRLSKGYYTYKYVFVVVLRYCTVNFFIRYLPCQSRKMNFPPVF